MAGIHACWDSIRFQEPDECMQPICKAVVVSKGFDTISPRYAWFQSSLSSRGKVETFVTDHTQIFERISVGKAVTMIQQLGKSESSGIEADDLRLFCVDRQAFSVIARSSA
eukprot:1151072-Pelagomonas_calceolata.AAC.1